VFSFPKPDYEYLAQLNLKTGQREYAECPVKEDVENI
jgi:hypothetical protein